MPVADPAFGWQEALAAFAIVLIASFLVTWVVTDLLHVHRTAYVAILAVTVTALGAGYLAWSGTSLSELATSAWGWGLVAGLVAWAITAPLIARLPAHPHVEGTRLAGKLAWEAAVYGAAEAILLATLPVLAVWQATAAAGWTDGGWTKAGSGALAILGALLVILVHHLGYAQFRSRAARPMLAGALVACGLQALAFMLTGSIWAPVVAHIALHGQLVFRGDEMPPVYPRAEAGQPEVGSKEALVPVAA